MKKRKAKIIYLPVVLAALIIYLVANLFLKQDFNIRERAAYRPPQPTIEPFPTKKPRTTPKPQKTPVPSPTATATSAPIPAKRVFVTSLEYEGSLGGLSGADLKCQQSANSASLGGTWKAWLSSSTVSAASRLTHSSGAYKLIDGTTIANNWTDLIDGTIQHAINITEYNHPLNTLINVWTNTTTNGDIYNNLSFGPTHCQDWTSRSGDDKGGLGYVDSTLSYWTQSGYGYCSQLEKLFCFEQ